ncbi:flagellar hook-basal body protein [Lacrimispora saccharolytica]|uniref:Fagellar hook-basal body protein n=1 Tax=Lacrimispora saccharolytica (strain ATCC 35040 / DSM 2544 / NRCC 2533 / WM1) TaxID=610130 RepID=D9R9Z9_LACSW|nr:flagellar hook-basal body protein [Lacrimispora saccharolytica]ADL05971.1 fagellar hook-basal body protein [[Clostridium] saccharolyticum WM1]QRV19899.1 flagellar hook-basal body protein [Lacrimispora saccharolytica]
MEQSFYIGALGALGQQTKLGIVSNNVANVNTVGFKAQYSVFSDLVHAEMRNTQGNNGAKSGSGTKVDQTKTDFSAMPYKETGLEHDYAIAGEGFFMLKDPVTGEVSYSRDGRFQLSRMEDKFYLVNSDNKRVLNMDQEEISYDVKPATYPGSEEETEEEETELEEGEHDPRAIGVYTFARRDGMESQGDNVFSVTEKNGEPILLENAKVVKRALEESGVDFAQEMTRMIEAQRAYSYALKMVQTSDEVEATINTLR